MDMDGLPQNPPPPPNHPSLHHPMTLLDSDDPNAASTAYQMPLAQPPTGGPPVSQRATFNAGIGHVLPQSAMTSAMQYAYDQDYQGTTLASPLIHRNSSDNSSGGHVISTSASDLSGPSQSVSPHTHSSSDAQNQHIKWNTAQPYLTGHAETQGSNAPEKSQPAWTEMKTKAGKERKRLPLACIACRRKKVRCSGEKPACKHCSHSRIPCVYRATPRKATPRTDYMAMLDKRLRRMEERITKAVPKDERSEGETMPRATLKPGQQNLASSKSGSGSKRAAAEAFAEEVDHLFQHNSTAAGSNGVPLPLDDEEELSIMQEGIESLPSPAIQEYLVELFFDYIYGQAYFLLHKPSLLRKLKSRAVPPVLLLAMCAISARFADHPEIGGDPAFLRGQVWAAEARRIVLRRFDKPNIIILIVLVILALHEFGCCNGGRSWMFSGMAIRMAFALNLHQDLEIDTSCSVGTIESRFVDREVRRRLGWSCFLMDRFNSSGTGRPMFLSEEWYHIQLPIKEELFHMSIPGSTEGLLKGRSAPESTDVEASSGGKQNMGVAAYLIRVVAIWGRIIQYFNSGGRQHETQPLWSPQSKFESLRRTLDEFKTDLPAELVLNQENLQRHSASRISNQFLFMHVIFHQATLFIHKQAIPTSPKWKPSQDIPKTFLNQCGRTALEAATQISKVLEISNNHRLVAPFTGYCAFLSGSVHIFGIHQKNERLRALSKQNLEINVSYLKRNKKSWGAFDYISSNLKEVYCRFHSSTGESSIETPPASPYIPQYADWLDRYPNGYFKSDEAHDIEIDASFLDNTSDLQSVEKFFASLSTTDKASNKALKRTQPKSKAPGSSKTLISDVKELEPVAKFKTEQDSNKPVTKIPAEMISTTKKELPSPPENHQFGDVMHADHAYNLNAPIQYSTYAPDPSSSHLSLVSPLQQDLLPQIERQMVFDAYGEANAASDSFVDPNGVIRQNPWLGGHGQSLQGVPVQMDYADNSNTQADNGTWFIPFNYDPA